MFPLRLLLALGVPIGLPAQLLVSAEQDLAFGEVIRGVLSDVEPTDAMRAGRFRVEGPARARVTIDITWPNGLLGSGSAMPFTMRNRDAAMRDGGSLNQVRFINPRNTVQRRLDRTGFFYLDIGGTASPTASQPAGQYSGPILLTVSVL